MATKLTTSLVFDNTTDANFRAWGNGISTALSTLGWVNNNDTGTINWTTVLKPTAGGNFPGFEVWHGAASANQTAMPIFFRIDYGASGSGQGIPALKLTFGTSTNGSGTIGGQTLAVQTLSGTAAQGGATQYTCNFYGDGSKWACILWDNNTAGRPMYWGIERNLSSTGVEGAAYYTVVMGAGAGGSVLTGQSSIFVSGSPASTTLWNALITIRTGDDATSIAFNGNAPALPIFPNVGYLDYPLTIFMTLKFSDGVNGSTFTTNNWYGGSHTYTMSTNGCCAKCTGLNANAFATLAMRFE